MSTPNIQLIVTDLDGTFLGEKAALLEENAAAFRRASEQGIHIAIASGRLARVCSRIASDLGLKACHIIGMNGAQELNSPFGDVIRLVTYPDALSAALVALLDHEGCFYNLYTERAVFTNQVFTPERRESFHQSFARCGVEVIQAPRVYALAKARPLIKVLFKSSGDPAAYERARAKAAALPGLYLTAASAHNTEVMQLGLSKESGVRALVSRLGISMENVLALGDFDNDAELLSACKIGVAMGNCSERARAAATHISKSNTEFGVACAVNALLEGKLDALPKGGRK